MCLPELDHQWPRFVLPTGAKFASTNGYLPDPEGDYERYSNPDLLSIPDFFNRRCCILLGDAGLGKSDVLRKEYERLRQTSQNPAHVIFGSLRDFGSDMTAEQFLGSAGIDAWISDPTAELFLFLDSLDEALLTVSSWSALLGRALSRWPLDRLWFRIACRPAFWPDSLGSSLAQGFADDLSKAILIPLRERDVLSAAAEHGIEPELLSKEIQRANAMTFAARPLTLKMIFGIFAVNGHLPETHVKMYEQGCRFLAQEHNRDVLEGHQLTSVSLDHRIEIIERIAAMSVFCDRRFLQHPNAAEAPLMEGTLTASSICSADVTMAELREVSATALFSFQTADVLVWTNWSYAEFLAASWCISKQLTTTSIRNLISVAGDNGFGIPQQLASTATWIGELRRELQRYLIELNPNLLLFLDENAVSPTVRPRLVTCTVERKRTWELECQVSSYAHRFQHPGIAKQLSKYLRRPRKVRECLTALNIAIACRLSELSPQLLALVDNDKVLLEVRQLAASAIAYMGTEQARKSIQHLAVDPIKEDVRDNLKGAALSANWPGNFSMEELTPLLTLPRSGNHSGSYEAFLVKFAKGLDATLSVADVVHLMEWAQQDWLAGNRNAFFDPIIDKALVLAWESLEDPDVLRRFVASLLKRLRNHLPGFPWKVGLSSKNEWPDRLAQNAQRRALLFRETLRTLENSPYLLRSACSALCVATSDANLLLDIARGSDAGLRNKINTVFFMLGREETDVLDAVHRGLQEGILDPALATGFSIVIDSEEAQELRNAFGRADRQAIIRRSAAEEKRRLLFELLDRSEAGEADAWYRIWSAVLMADWPAWDGSAHLERMACWKELDEPTHDRLHRAAHYYTLSGTRPPLDFLGEPAWPDWASAEYAALFSSIEHTPGDLVSVDDLVWERWSKLSLWYPFAGLEERARASRGWLATRSEPFLSAAQELWSLYIAQNRCSSIADGLRFDWTPEFRRFFLELVHRTEMNACWDILCSIGLVEAPQCTEMYVWAEFERLLGQFGEARDERLVTIVIMMLRHAKPGT